MAMVPVRSGQRSPTVRVFAGESNVISWTIESQWVFPAWDEMITLRAGDAAKAN